MMDRFCIYIRTLFGRMSGTATQAVKIEKESLDFKSQRERAVYVIAHQLDLRALIAREEEDRRTLHSKMEEAVSHYDVAMADKYLTEVQALTESINRLEQTMATARDRRAAMHASIQAARRRR